MGLFSKQDAAAIKRVAEKSKEVLAPPKKLPTKSINSDLQRISKEVVEYFKDSKAELITSKEQLHEYVTKLIECGYAGIDTETTGLDRVKDTIVGSSLYYPGGVEVYIPNKHIVPIFDELYKNQLTYEEVAEEFDRIRESGTKLIFANADFDLAMIYKDYKIDFNDNCYYDVILAWRCLKENENDNKLKSLYNKYVLKGKGDPKNFSDFFPASLFPYCKPEIAKLYAANDAKITFELFQWQLPFVTKDHPKCKKAHLERIADLVWNVEIPLIKVCQNMHRTGIYVDKDVALYLNERYNEKQRNEIKILQNMVQEILDNAEYKSYNRPFNRGVDFNPNSTIHVKYLIYDLLKVPVGKNGTSTDKSVLGELNMPVTNQILKARSLSVLISTFVEKLPNATTSDSRIHAQFKQIGAATGRMSSAEPNVQNIPSHATDIRHLFRATPGYVMLSSDYSQQEPKITAFVSQDPNMIKAFQEGKDIYATIASIAFQVPYEKCLEFHPETGEYQSDGKARRGEAKTIVLGICYGRSVATIGEQLYGKDTNLSAEDKTKKAQFVYDSVLKAFPNLRNLMLTAQDKTSKVGYTETILGRRRHIPDMTLPEFEFKAMKGYINPDVDPLDVSTLASKSDIPDRIVNQLKSEFAQYKYLGQIIKRTKELADQKIRVINNRPKITEATRQVVNSIVQGSAADMTKMAILNLESSEEWKALGGRLLLPVHDELICEVPMEKWKEGGELLSKLMSDAGDFLPFPINCDVETSLRWYGLSYPCPYTKPNSMSNLSEDEIKWLQYHILETEVLLPVFNDENGEKPKGDASRGVNGIMTPELELAIKNYRSRYNLLNCKDSEFFDHIETKVQKGTI